MEQQQKKKSHDCVQEAFSLSLSFVIFKISNFFLLLLFTKPIEPVLLFELRGIGT